MSQIKKKFIKFGTGSEDVNSRVIPAHYTASNYTPAQVASEGNDKVSAHLQGIDSALGAAGVTPGDIGVTSFSAANNQASPANVTGFAFNNATTRGFDSFVTIVIDATTDLYEFVKIQGIQKGATWDISIERTGDESGVNFSITNSGQIQYTSNNYSGFVSATIKFRAITVTL